MFCDRLWQAWRQRLAAVKAKLPLSQISYGSEKVQLMSLMRQKEAWVMKSQKHVLQIVRPSPFLVVQGAQLHPVLRACPWGRAVLVYLDHPKMKVKGGKKGRNVW